MKFVGNWTKQNNKCYYCKTDKSVKWTLTIPLQNTNKQSQTVCVCNKCVLLHAHEEYEEEDHDVV